MTNFTPEQLISYYYGETDSELSNEIKEALASDWTLREKYQVITEAVARLNKVMLQPRPQAVNNILSYGRRKIGLAELEN